MNGVNKKYTLNSLIIEFDCNNLENIIISEMQKSKSETGGIIIGNYKNDMTLAQITKFDYPTKDSIKKPFSFIRGKKGLTKKLEELWKSNQYYLGEWHLHPFASPTASKTDTAQLLEISIDANYKCPEPIMIIVGYNGKTFTYKVYISINNQVLEMKELF